MFLGLGGGSCGPLPLIPYADHLAQPLQLADDRKAQLNSEISFLFAFVKTLIKGQAANIEKSMGVRLLPVDSTKLCLGNSGTAQAYANQTPEDLSGTIVVGMKLLQAAYLASLHPTFATADVLSTRREIENLAYLSHVKIDKKEGFGWSSLISTQPGDKTPARQMSRDIGHLGGFVPKVLPAGVQYSGSLLFVIAHELGHISLGHGVKDIVCFDRELAADTFAASVLGESLVAMSIQEEALDFFDAPRKETSIIGLYLTIDRNELRRYTGFSLFFEKSYEVVKLKPSSSSCSYPEPEKRLQISTRTVEAIASVNEDGL